MANIYGVCPERAAQHKGYSDFVQHTNPLKEGLLRLSISGAQTLRNSLGCVQIKLGEMLSLKLKADNSLIGLISVRESELVNLLIQLNYRESRESANSLIQLNSVDSTESASSLIMSKTCTAGTSPNVLMKSDFVSFPSRDDTQKAQKEKGNVRSAALWDDCSFNHEENHYSTDLDNNADLRHDKNQQLSHPFLGGEHILTTIGGWDLRLYGTLSPAQTLHTEIIGTQNLQVTKRYSQNNPEIIVAVDSANDIGSAQLSGSGLAFLRCLNLISLCNALTTNCPVLSPDSLSSSTALTISCGTRTSIFLDFALTALVAIYCLHCSWCQTIVHVIFEIKSIDMSDTIVIVSCLTPKYAVSKTRSSADGCNICGASIHNVIGANTMAFTHSTQTRPKFTYLFLGTPSDLPTCTPTVLRAEADTEAEARAKFIDWDLTFAAQIRTAAPSRLQLFSTDDGFMWIYEQRQEASHA
ncbi:MAG: host cell division inhibitor Icd-like protein [Acinetobacter sp.]